MKKGKAKEAMLTVSQVADRLGESARNIRNWARSGVFKNASLEESYRGPVWLIPESDLHSFERPVPGPKKGSKKGKAKA
jgi:hypothetical protein